MKFDPNKHHRQSIRLKGYDYTQPGAYFITICTWQRENLFGEIQDGEMHLSRYGEAVKFNWHYLQKPYSHVELDSFVIMPNHIHGIIVLTDKNSQGGCIGTGFVGAGSPESSQRSADIYKPAPTHHLGSPESFQHRPDICKPAPTNHPHPSPVREDLPESSVRCPDIGEPAPTKRHGLPEIVRGFKTSSARRINQLRCVKNVPLWQRGYYEHIIRNQSSLRNIREYIINNPRNWGQDKLHPENIFPLPKTIYLNLDSQVKLPINLSQ